MWARVLFVAVALTPLRCLSASHCIESIPTPALLDRQWPEPESGDFRVTLPATNGPDLLIGVTEKEAHARIEVVDSNGEILTEADSPVDRIGSRYLYLRGTGSKRATIVMRAQAPMLSGGMIRIRVWSEVRAPDTNNVRSYNCRRALASLAEAGVRYARGRSIALANRNRPASGDTVAAHAAFLSALQGYQTALQFLAEPTFAPDRGEVLLELAAICYYDLQDWAGSESWARQAAATFGSLTETYLQARAEAILAAAWMELATRSASVSRSSAVPGPASRQLDRARSLLSRLSRLHRDRGETYDEALQINNIGVAYIYEARFERAIPPLTRGRTLFERLGNTTRTALSLQNLAICYWGLGHLSAALTEFDRALVLMKPAPDPDLYLLTLNNSGLAHYAAGQFDRALQLQTQALDFATLTQADRARARSDYGIGVVYYAIGDRTLAAQFLQSALDLSKPELDARVRVATLRALAVIEQESGQLDSAIAHNSEALSLATAPSARARILLKIAQDYTARNDPTAALRLLANLIAEPPGGDPLVRAMARMQRGMIRHGQGSLQSAETDLRNALATFSQFDSLAERFESEVELARIQADRGDPSEALATIRRALQLAPELRAQTSNPEYRASIGQSVRSALELELRLLREQYERAASLHQTSAMQRLAAASLVAVDQSRATEFEAWRSQHLRHQEGDPVAKLLGMTEGLYRGLADRRFQLATREDRAGVDDSRARILRDEIAGLRVRLGVANAQLALLTAPQGPHATAARRSQSWPTLAAISSSRALVEYWLGDQAAFAWTISTAGINWVRLQSPTVINTQAKRLHDALRSISSQPVNLRTGDCEQLYRLIIEPLGKEVASAMALTIVPDGALHYVPFGALRDAQRGDGPYLAQHAVISVAPALRLVTNVSTVARPRVTGSVPGRMLLVADPVYTEDDPRVRVLARRTGLSRSSTQPPPTLAEPIRSDWLQRLASTAREADEIRAEYGGDQVDLLSGLDATRENVLTKDLSSYRFIHIASHGIIDAEIPQLSALLLGRFGPGGRVADPDIRAGDLLSRTFTAQAVVLSACDTALGKQYPDEGLIGLRYAALARGAHTVVASLWPVSDGITADLMTDMYRAIQANDAKEGPVSSEDVVATSLTLAMRGLLARTPTLDPALWAPFAVYVAGNVTH